MEITEAAKYYKILCEESIVLKIRKKNEEKVFEIKFGEENCFHLLGFNKLSDIIFNEKKKRNILTCLLDEQNKRLIENIKKSPFYETESKMRLYFVSRMYWLLKNGKIQYKENPDMHSSDIKSNLYLTYPIQYKTRTGQMIVTKLQLHIIKENKGNRYIPCSIYIGQNEKDYRGAIFNFYSLLVTSKKS